MGRARTDLPPAPSPGWARPAVDRSAGRHERRPVGPAHGRAVARPAIALSPYQTCHRRFQLWQRSGRLDRLLQRLAEDLRDRGKIDLSEAFVDATFASAKKGALRLVDHGREKFEYQFHSHVRPASAENARL